MHKIDAKYFRDLHHVKMLNAKNAKMLRANKKKISMTYCGYIGMSLTTKSLLSLPRCVPFPLAFGFYQKAILSKLFSFQGWKMPYGEKEPTQRLY